MIEAEIDARLSRAKTKKGRTQRVVLAHLRRHLDAGELPTNNRFVYYELEQLGLAMKPGLDDKRPNRRRSIGWPPGSQDVNDALLDLRARGVVPYAWLTDDERTLHEWEYAETVADYVFDRIGEARINPWAGKPPPLVICESKATAGVLLSTVAEYVCPIIGTKGQAHGILVTEVAPLLRDGRRVLYLGDLDRSGADIESNTRGVLERAVGCELDWTRLGMTEGQAAARGIEPIWKVDARDRVGGWAIEVESLGQTAVVALVRAALDVLLPEPLGVVRAREEVQREVLRNRWVA